MIVYRYENETGNGPYWERGNISGELLDMLILHNYCNNHPDPWGDVPKYNYGLIHGFVSMPQLIAWFGRECRALLADEGFKLIQYEVPINKILMGGKQCAFKRKDATKLGEATCLALTNDA